MKILAVIPARGGSKRLPGKNTRVLGGKPMIAWSIDVVKDVPEVCDILISTDDPGIATVCEAAGASVPWLRPAELATDTANSVDVALHALDWYEARKGAVDGLLLLQPTSPFRTTETVRKGIELFHQGGDQSILGVSPASSHPMWTLKMDGGHLVPYMGESGFDKRSQDLSPAYVVNGCFYLVSPALLRESRSFFGGTLVPLLVESMREALDIDTEWDWTIAEAVLASVGDRQRSSKE